MKSLAAVAAMLALATSALAYEGTVRPIIDRSSEIQHLMLVPSCPPDVPVTVSNSRFVCGYNVAKPKLTVKTMSVMGYGCTRMHDNRDCNMGFNGGDVERVSGYRILLKGEWDSCTATPIAFSGSFTIRPGDSNVSPDPVNPRKFWINRTHEWTSAIATCQRYE